MFGISKTTRAPLPIPCANRALAKRFDLMIQRGRYVLRLQNKIAGMTRETPHRRAQQMMGRDARHVHGVGHAVFIMIEPGPLNALIRHAEDLER
jgi:hypothetical protein